MNKHDLLLDKLRGCCSLDHCWSLINKLNREAHDETYEMWHLWETDKHSKGDDEAFQDDFQIDEWKHERIDAFRDLLDNLNDFEQKSIWYWADNDTKFQQKFKQLWDG